MAIQWSDDFEPNTSIKSNRGSVWIKTLTFISNDDQQNNINNTYPIAIGHKGDDHNNIERLYAQELNELRNGINNRFFSSSLKKYVRIHLEVIVALGDQPERRSLNFLMNGNSTFGSRYGYSSRTSEIVDILPFCSKCYDEIKSNLQHKELKCSKCLRWDIMSNIELSST